MAAVAEAPAAVIVVVPEPALDPAPAAVIVVVPEPGALVDEATLAAWCGETLAAFKVPSLWDLRTEPLPRNASGKVLKNVLSGEVLGSQIEE